jgi:chaperonin GroES
VAINVKPLGDRVLVQTLEREASGRDGLAVGTAKLDDNGEKIEFNVKVGDKVLISKYGGTQIKIDGEKCLIMREDLGIIA